jgi:hypothetical protein
LKEALQAFQHLVSPGGVGWLFQPGIRAPQCAPDGDALTKPDKKMKILYLLPSGGRLALAGFADKKGGPCIDASGQLSC